MNYFREKMAFFTSVKASVPIYGEETEEALQPGAPLQSVEQFRHFLSTSLAGGAAGPQQDDLTLNLSTETVNTITEEDGANHSSQNSTPTPTLQSERFSYEVDPELGAFV